MEQRTRVLYQALADFSALTREVRQAKREVAQLKAAESAYNTSSTKANKSRTTALQARSRATTAEGQALRTVIGLVGRYTTAQTRLTVATKLGTKAIQAENRALTTNETRLLAAAAAARAYAAQQRSISRNTAPATDSVRSSSPNQRRSTTSDVRFRPSDTDASHILPERFSGNVNRATESTNRWGRALGWLRKQLQDLTPAMTQANSGATRLQRAFVKLGNWRPRLVPPFIALLPIIASVVAAINPLVALLGAVGTAAFGLGANIASLSGAFLALPGILSAVVGGIASVIASMGGVGNVFKTYSAMQKAVGKSSGAGGGGGGGESQADRADRLARAETGLAKAQRAVTKAQANLNKAREQALEDLIDLRVEVSRASLNEERAIANLQQARDSYNNVMADPGSQKGDKLDAAVAIKEAEADLADVRKQNIQNQKELTAAEKKGIEGSDRVLDAKEDLQDSIYAERDAQKALKDEYQGGAAAASALSTATDEYNEALAKLSPSARSVVLALIGMQDQWNDMKRDIQENFFSQFANDMDKVPRIIQTIGNFLRPAARAMGEFVSALITLLASPEWTRDLATIGEQNADVIGNLGEGFLSLITFFKDLIIAAAPFTDWLTGAFADGLDNLSQLLDTDPEKQGLAAWLEIVRGRLEKWWGIVKNVGSTLFNYGAAASGFGDWLSDGFLEMTDRWKTASEKAREDGSPYKKFLEDIQPLLSNVNGLFGDFFGWMSQEIMDPKNIEDANDLVTLLRDDLGPALGEFLDALAKTDIDEKIIEAVSSIIRSLTEIIEAGGAEAFETFADIVTGFFSAIADFLSGLEPGQLDLIMKFLGAITALSFIGKFTGLTTMVGGLLSLVGGSGKLSKLFGGFKGLDKLKFGKLLGKTGLLAGIGTVIGLIGSGFQIGDIFGKLNSGDVEGAHKAVADVDDGFLFSENPLAPVPGTPGYNPLPMISDAAGGIDQIFGTNFKQDLQDFTDSTLLELGNFFTDVQTNWDTFWGGIATGWDTFWTNLGDPAFWAGLGEGLGTFITDIGTNWDTFWSDTGENLDTAGAEFGENWKSFWGTANTEFGNFIDDVTTGKLWENIGTELESFGATFGANWTSFWDGIWNGAKTAVTNIGNTWNGIKNALAIPVNWVISNVWNGAIVPFWNGLAGKLGWSTLGYASTIGGSSAPASAKAGGRNIYAYAEGGVLPGYTPGRDVHNFVSPTGGRLALSGGEAIMRPEFTRAVGGKKGVDALNKKARSGQAFANGGVFNGGGAQKFASGGIWEVAGDVWDSMQSFFKSPLKYVTEGMGNLIAPMLSGIQGNDYGRMVSKLPYAVAKGYGDLAASRAKDARRAQPKVEADDTGMKWRSMWAIVKKAFPSATLNSAYRPGSRTVNGGMSYHSAGRAIDTTASMTIFDWLKKNYPNSKELIYSPAGGRQLQNGREHYWGGAVRAQHWDHVHWAMKNGGVFPGGAKRKGTHDNGGWLPTGRTATNLSGRPEAVLTNEESQGLKALLRGTGLTRGDGAVGLGTSVGSLRGAAQQVVDNSINIQNLNVNNPVPEKPSVSLPKAIRQIGYMQNARTA